MHELYLKFDNVCRNAFLRKKIRKKHVKCVKLDNSENLKLYAIYREFKALLKA